MCVVCVNVTSLIFIIDSVFHSSLFFSLCSTVYLVAVSLRCTFTTNLEMFTGSVVPSSLLYLVVFIAVCIICDFFCCVLEILMCIPGCMRCNWSVSELEARQNQPGTCIFSGTVPENQGRMVTLSQAPSGRNGHLIPNTLSNAADTLLLMVRTGTQPSPCSRYLCAALTRPVSRSKTSCSLARDLRTAISRLPTGNLLIPQCDHIGERDGRVQPRQTLLTRAMISGSAGKRNCFTRDA
jgi:hypothetical protein